MLGVRAQRLSEVSVLKRTILLENLFSEVLYCSLYNFDPLSDEQLKKPLKVLNRI
jgi:hypothetical protein